MYYAKYSDIPDHPTLIEDNAFNVSTILSGKDSSFEAYQVMHNDTYLLLRSQNNNISVLYNHNNNNFHFFIPSKNIATPLFIVGNTA